MSGWAEWLKGAMVDAGMNRGELIELIGRRPDGKPKVDASRLSNWLARGTTPSYRNVLLVARALGAPEADALASAGYDRDGTVLQQVAPGSARIASQLELSDEEARLVAAFVQGMRTQAGAH